ncbi:hypothetical protein GCM10011492_33450 [Flexivirga endophytica]|uniref:Uncharacterized protein n=1 Tax=Flexivirga endophytica TaxID=1849103 RepID=A0A916WXE9_9MICO|nr:hypothetical protein [Flexivirga endophytica]GGB39951.1 hypothetical protein GCM10011492_33450 [Flexivirga endophytica]GHB47839.1 hypothetical protein GCM10008112_15840 [Flexivirga endophytica]
MGQLTVDARSLDSGAASLRGAHGVGLLMLARAIVDDVCGGVGASGDSDVLSSALPQLVGAVTERTTSIAGRLETAAGAYRRTEWLVRVAMADRR